MMLTQDLVRYNSDGQGDHVSGADWTEARYLGREKRFTVHAELADGSRVAVHTNNTGRLTGCGEPGARCWLSPATAPGRKLPWTLEIMEAPAWPAGSPAARRPESPVPFGAPAPAPGQVLVGVNTAAPNLIVAAAITAGLLPALADCRVERQEVRYPEDIAPGSRADLLLRDATGGPVWVEIKNVTWVRGGIAAFPDAPTTRGRKHLADLTVSYSQVNQELISGVDTGILTDSTRTSANFSVYPYDTTLGVQYENYDSDFAPFERTSLLASYQRTIRSRTMMRLNANTFRTRFADVAEEERGRSAGISFISGAGRSAIFHLTGDWRSIENVSDEGTGMGLEAGWQQDFRALRVALDIRYTDEEFEVATDQRILALFFTLTRRF